MNDKGRVLIIEDDELLSRLLSLLLVRAGFEAMIVPDGLTALETMDWFKPNVIFLDMYLPFLNGWEFLQKYREQTGSHVPVIASSALKLDRTSLGEVADFFQKPFDLPHFVQVVEDNVVPQ